MIMLALALNYLMLVPSNVGCPPPSEEAVQEVVYRLEHDQDFIAAIGASQNEHESVRYLSDYSTCDLIYISAEARGFGQDTTQLFFRYVYVRSDDYYYLVGIQTPRDDGLLELGLLPLIVMNRSYQVIHTILR